MRGAVVFAALLGLTACREPDRVRLVSFSGAEAPVLAQKLGFFKNVEFQETASAAKAMEALLAGSADAIIGTYEQALQVQAQGKDVLAVRLLTECHCLAMVASPKSGVRSLADLKGKVVGVAGPGGPMQTFAAHLLGREKVPVSYAAIGVGATAFAAIDSGKVDAGVVLASTLIALQSRHPNLIVLAETFSPAGSQSVFGFATYPAMALLARREWVDAHRETANRLSGALGQAIDWIHGHSAEDVRDKLGSGDLAAMKMHLPRYSKTGEMDPVSARGVLGLLEKSGKVPAGRVRLESTWLQ